MHGKKIKIGVVIECLNVGGTETGIVRNHPRLDRERFEVVVLCFNHPGVMAEQLTRQDIRVVSRLSGPRVAAAPPVNPGVWGAFWYWVHLKLGNLQNTLDILSWLGRMLKREKPDIAHFFLPYAYCMGTLASLRRPGIKRVMTRSSLNDYQRAKTVTRFLERWLWHRFLHRAVGNSRAILDQLREEGLPAEKLYLLYNGIDAAPFSRQPESRAQCRDSLSLPEDAFVLTAVGNLYEYKGHDDLIEACALAADQLPINFRLLIAGGDPAGNREKYQALSRRRGLVDRIEFLGAYDRIAELLWAADVLVHPSHHEGFPNAVLEAMAASLPVIATRVGGIPEQVVAGLPDSDPFQPVADETGWLVPPKNPEALARALVASGRDAERRRAMGERAFRRVRQNFSIEKSTAAYEMLYLELAS